MELARSQQLSMKDIPKSKVSLPRCLTLKHRFE